MTRLIARLRDECQVRQYLREPIGESASLNSPIRLRTIFGVIWERMLGGEWRVPPKLTEAQCMRPTQGTKP